MAELYSETNFRPDEFRRDREILAQREVKVVEGETTHQFRGRVGRVSLDMVRKAKLDLLEKTGEPPAGVLVIAFFSDDTDMAQVVVFKHTRDIATAGGDAL